MQKIKKCISVLLAVVMLASIFAIGAFAGVPALDSSSSQNIAMALEVEHADGTAATTVKAGETITVKVYVTAKDAEARIAGGAITMFWNSDVYTYVDREFGPACIGDDSLYTVNNTAAAYTNTVANMTAAEKAYGWNIAGNFQITNVAGTNNTNATLIQANSATPFLTVTLKVNDGVADGTVAPIGIPETSVAPKNTTRMNYTYIQTYTAASSTITQNKSKSLYSLDTVAADLTVGSAEAPKVYEDSIVTYWKDQIKMEKDDYSSFSIRHLAEISKEDWEANFGTTEDSANATITDIGFILATGNGEFDKDAAANWLEAGATDATFTKADVKYVSTGMKDGYYVYSVVITGCTNPDASLSSLGYVVWKDAEGTTHYSYFDDVMTETFRELYDGYVEAH